MDDTRDVVWMLLNEGGELLRAGGHPTSLHAHALTHFYEQYPERDVDGTQTIAAAMALSDAQDAEGCKWDTGDYLVAVALLRRHRCAEAIP